jgi:transposase-like protein
LIGDSDIGNGWHLYSGHINLYIWHRHSLPIFDYPMEIRRVIYTTNAIESLNRSLRKVIKTKAVFPSEEAVFRLMYLAMQTSRRSGTGR